MGMLKLETDAKMAFQVLFREAFKSGFMPEFKYDEDPKKSLIDIRREFPKTLRKFPIIVIGASNADSSITEIGPNAPRYVDNDLTDPYVEYRGLSTLALRFTIVAGSERDRDKKFALEVKDNPFKKLLFIGKKDFLSKEKIKELFRKPIDLIDYVSKRGLIEKGTFI